MYKKNLITYSIITAVTIAFGGCASFTPKCSGSRGARDYFCYQGYNFGKNRTYRYKLGVKHGCRTANGYFRKNYSLSKSSIDYIKGWDKGRATCRLIIPEEAEAGVMRTEYQQSIDENRYYRR